MGNHRRELDWPVITGVIGVFVVGRENPNGSGLYDVRPVGPDVHWTLFHVSLERGCVGKESSVNANSVMTDFYRVAGSGGDRLEQSRVLIWALQAAWTIAACNGFGCGLSCRAERDERRIRVVCDDVEACPNRSCWVPSDAGNARNTDC